MGQYYNIAFSDADGQHTTITDRQVEGADDYVFAKLMEFCWWGTPTSLSLLTILSRQPSRILVLGDYAEHWELPTSYNCPNYAEMWNRDDDYSKLPAPDENLDIIGKYFVNHTKKVYFGVDEYIASSSKKYYWSKEPMVINPIILLCAIGNGEGGGDYDYHDPVNKELVGTWAWDELQIMDEIPPTYQHVDVKFYENYKN